GEQRIHARKVHAVDLDIDLVARRLFAQIEDRGAASRSQHTVDLVERAERIGEILEGGAADDDVERAVGVRHVRGVSLAECDVEPSARARSVAIFTNDALMSSPYTRKSPRRATSKARYPGPGATSRIRAPGSRS